MGVSHLSQHSGNSHWMQSAVKHPGSFTKQAQAAGMPVQKFANHVLANKKNYSGTTVRRASLAKTFSKVNKKGDK